ncbi:choline/ethanolamine kinase family protein [Pseudomonadota bacterium]
MTDPEKALAGVPCFSGAIVEQQLSDGPTNASYLLSRAGAHYVLRLDKPAAKELGLDRLNEQRIYEALSAADMAPAVVYSNVSEGILLRPFVPGRSWTPDDLANTDQLQRLGRLLRRLHGLPAVGAAFDPVGAARRYAGRARDDQTRAMLKRIEQLAIEIRKRSELPALCHNDLVCQNILEGGSLMLIDWEYAAVGDRFFDLAVVLQHHGLDGYLAGIFISGYLGREATAGELSQLSLQRDFYRCLLELWNWRVSSEA